MRAGSSKRLRSASECLQVRAFATMVGLRTLIWVVGDFATRDIRWAPDGKGLVLVDKETFCCAFEVEEGEEEEGVAGFSGLGA